MLHPIGIVVTAFHHAIDNVNKAIKINIILNLLNGTIVVKKTNGEQVRAFIIYNFNLTLMEIPLYGEPQSIFDSHGIVKPPAHYDWKIVPEDADYVLCHFHDCCVLWGCIFQPPLFKISKP